MDFEFNDDQELLRDSVRRFLADRAPIAYVREMYEDPTGTTPDVWKGLAGLGLTGLLVPEARGGAGMGMTDMGVVLEEMGRAVHPGPFLSSAVGAVSAVTAVSGPDDELLAGLADGSVVGTLALFDAAGRSSWRRPTLVASGDRLTGTKVLVPDGVGADQLLVTARAGPELALFAVEATAEGVTVEPTVSPDGSRKLASVDLHGAAGRRLGAGDASRALAGVIDRLLIAYVVDGVGAAAAALDLAVAYGSDRQQFGRPIGSFQAVQHLCADMLLALESAKAGAYFALWAADSTDAAEVHRAATMAKAFSGDALFRIGADAIQVFGGIGYTWEADVHLFYKRLLTLQHLHGGSDEHLAELASIVID
jgi:alkylation response protein AidB-like acyl-CoA dehydrogenase